jgi:hypothetical protein
MLLTDQAKRRRRRRTSSEWVGSTANEISAYLLCPSCLLRDPCPPSSPASPFTSLWSPHQLFTMTPTPLRFYIPLLPSVPLQPFLPFLRTFSTVSFRPSDIPYPSCPPFAFLNLSLVLPLLPPAYLVGQQRGLLLVADVGPAPPLPRPRVRQPRSASPSCWRPAECFVPSHRSHSSRYVCPPIP